jgi:DNA modification methylase
VNAITPSSIRILHGDCRDVLLTLPDLSVQCCVTSPPYYGLRDYGVDGQIGLESSPDEYVSELVAAFSEMRRVLRNDGTLWLNLGDSYASPTKGSGGDGRSSGLRKDGRADDSRIASAKISISHQIFSARKVGMGDAKPKDLLGIPWRVAFALQADGWWLRSAIVWAKPNPMPESCTDRPTSSYEMVFLLSKRATYFYDADAIREENSETSHSWNARESDPLRDKHGNVGNGHSGLRNGGIDSGRNARNVWTISTKPYGGAHFATMPPDLAERCIKAGSKPGDTVLDPFGGAGTTGLVADRLGRRAVLIELNQEYAGMATGRISDDCPLFASVT